jgi:hypothetical protein
MKRFLKSVLLFGALLLMLLLPGPLFAQHSVTGNFGGTAASLVDNGNGGQAFVSGFISPPATSTVNSLSMWVGNHQNATWGVGLYANKGLVLSSVANHSGSTTVYTGTITGGGSNAYAGTAFWISGFTHVVDNGWFTVDASTTTTLTLENAAGIAETSAALASTPGAKVCGDTSATNPPNGWNALTPTGCGTLAANTIFYVASYTASATQQQGTGDNSGACSSTGVGSVESASTLTPWPDPFPAVGSNNTPQENGCYAAYASLTYISSAAFTSSP